MTKKRWLPLKRGLVIDPKHRERLGKRIWLLLHIFDRADWETGIVYGWKDNDEAIDMAMPWRTVQEWRQELENFGYIKCIQKRRDMDILIYQWANPRSYGGETINPKVGTESDVHTEDMPVDGGRPTRVRSLTFQGTAQGTGTLRSKLRTLSIMNQESLIKGADAPTNGNGGDPLGLTRSDKPIDSSTPAGKVRARAAASLASHMAREANGEIDVSMFDEAVRDLARACLLAAAPRPAPANKKEIRFWNGKLFEYFNAGITPADITEAIRENLSPEKPLGFKWPGSIDWNIYEIHKRLTCPPPLSHAEKLLRTKVRASDG